MLVPFWNSLASSSSVLRGFWPRTFGLWFHDRRDFTTEVAVALAAGTSVSGELPTLEIVRLQLEQETQDVATKNTAAAICSEYSQRIQEHLAFPVPLLRTVSDISRGNRLANAPANLHPAVLTPPLPLNPPPSLRTMPSKTRSSIPCRLAIENGTTSSPSSM